MAIASEQLAEIKARRAALTEHTTRGDWRYDDCDTVLVFPADGGMAEAVASITVWGKEGSAEETALGEFIGHAPTDTDALLAEVDRLNGVVQFLGSHLQGGAAAFIDAAAAVERLRLMVGEYENTINSFTTCTECAGHLDREHTAEHRAATAEAERDRLRHALERAALSVEHDRASRTCQERITPVHNEDCPACDVHAALHPQEVPGG